MENSNVPQLTDEEREAIATIAKYVQRVQQNENSKIFQIRIFSDCSGTVHSDQIDEDLECEEYLDLVNDLGVKVIYGQ